MKAGSQTQVRRMGRAIRAHRGCDQEHDEDATQEDDGFFGAAFVDQNPYCGYEKRSE